MTEPEVNVFLQSSLIIYPSQFMNLLCSIKLCCKATCRRRLQKQTCSSRTLTAFHFYMGGNMLCRLLPIQAFYSSLWFSLVFAAYTFTFKKKTFVAISHSYSATTAFPAIQGVMLDSNSPATARVIMNSPSTLAKCGSS